MQFFFLGINSLLISFVFVIIVIVIVFVDFIFFLFSESALIPFFLFVLLAL